MLASTAKIDVAGHPDAAECQLGKTVAVERPWGNFRTLDIGSRFQVKRIVVNPGASLSLQKHYHRAEHWVVVKGSVVAQVGGASRFLTENESIYIPIGAEHRLENPGKLQAEIIEVQSGAYLGEDDIVRLSDVYGRCQSSNDTTPSTLEDES
jgi:mannose-1-phosphate guanylyltransferase/mannose-6-phosphate isomerase